MTGPSAIARLRGPASAQVTVDGRLHGAMPLQSRFCLRWFPCHRRRKRLSHSPARADGPSDGKPHPLTMNLPEATLILPDEQATSRTPTLSARWPDEPLKKMAAPSFPTKIASCFAKAPEYAGRCRESFCMRVRRQNAWSTERDRSFRTPRGDFAARLLDVGDSAMASAQSSGVPKLRQR